MKQTYLIFGLVVAAVIAVSAMLFNNFNQPQDNLLTVEKAAKGGAPSTPISVLM